MSSKAFTLEEARALLPHLSELLEACSDELTDFQQRVSEANQVYASAERALEAAERKSQRQRQLQELMEARAGFEQAIAGLSAAQRDYLERLGYWVDRISETGVILRDVRAGLLDFPARQGQLDYYLCWRLGEPDILYWHLVNDGFIGRKPLAALLEYC
ncbi:MAG TPA: DUF2203 domain-containing protein [Candidatus Obscuribacterales bacterium]